MRYPALLLGLVFATACAAAGTTRAPALPAPTGQVEKCLNDDSATWTFEIAVSAQGGPIRRNRIHTLVEWKEGRPVPNGLQQESFVQIVGPAEGGILFNIDGNSVALNRWNVDGEGVCKWSYREDTRNELGILARSFGYMFKRLN